MQQTSLKQTQEPRGRLELALAAVLEELHLVVTHSRYVQVLAALHIRHAEHQRTLKALNLLNNRLHTDIVNPNRVHELDDRHDRDHRHQHPQINKLILHTHLHHHINHHLNNKINQINHQTQHNTIIPLKHITTKNLKHQNKTNIQYNQKITNNKTINIININTITVNTQPLNTNITNKKPII